jgi:hypothetical protein
MIDDRSNGVKEYLRLANGLPGRPFIVKISTLLA